MRPAVTGRRQELSPARQWQGSGGGSKAKAASLLVTAAAVVLAAAVRTRRQRLLQLVCLLCVCYTECVEVLAAPDLELGHRLRLLDLDALGILPPSGEQEVLDLIDLLRLRRGHRAVSQGPKGCRFAGSRWQLRGGEVGGKSAPSHTGTGSMLGDGDSKCSNSHPVVVAGTRLSTYLRVI